MKKSNKSEVTNMLFKKVKNPNRPGRAPGGYEWVRDANNVILTNDKGEFAYQEAGTAPAAKKAVKGKRGKKKSAAKKAGRKAVEVTDDLRSALVLKKTYAGLSSATLEKIRDIADSLIDKAKESEKSALEKQILKLQNKLENI